VSLRWILSPLILSTVISYGQSVDASKNRLDIWEENVERTANDFYSNKKYDSAYKYYRISLRNARKIDSFKVEGRALLAIGSIFQNKDNFDSAMFYYENSALVFESIGDSVILPSALSNLGVVYKDKGLYEKALTVSFGALSFSSHLKKEEDLARTYNTIATCYKHLRRYNESLDYYRRAIAIQIKLSNVKGVGNSYNNIGSLFSQMQEYDSAIFNLQKALSIRELNDLKRGSTLQNLGEVAMIQEKYADAEVYFFRSLERKHLENDVRALSSTLNCIAELYIIKRDYASAMQYLTQADSLSHAFGSMEALRHNLQLKMALYDSLHDPVNGYLAAKELLIVKDSLIDEDMASRISDIQSRYEKEKYKQDLEESRKQTLNERNTKQMLIIVVVLTLVIALLLGYSIIVTRRNKRSVELLLKELHHRVKNNLQVLSSLLSLQSQQLTDSNAIQAVKASESRVNAMALIHRKLYLGDTNRTIDIKDYVTELVNYLAQTYGYYDDKLKLNLQIEDLAIDVDKAIPLGLILNELVSNAFKYAYTDHETPELYVGVSKDTPTTLMIQVRDNGQGMTEQKKGAPTSFGLKMVNTLTRELRGKLAVSASQGTTYVLNIPL